MTRIDTSEMIRKNQQDYIDTYTSMNWLTPQKADAATRYREELIRDIFDTHPRGPGWQFSETKLFTHSISPGCNLCGNGEWSCLFINGICNANCFYCPSSQKKPGQPMTSTIEFSNAQDYAEYVRQFQIKGVSFSGGEPLMTFDKVLLFLKTLRSKVSHPLYIWMYTNGLLLTEDKLSALRDNGLDEIRIDISANHYHLDALKKAVGVIPCVTVEIPAIPEDMAITKQVIKELHASGANHLNLHQLRCTPFNVHKFINRSYTFLHGPGITILETEAAALELIKFSLDQNISLPINYCSFTYRHQFQKAGAQKRNARLIKAPHEDVTATGHIRTMSLYGEKEQIGSLHRHLLSKGLDTSLWKQSSACDQLFFNEQLWPFLDLTGLRLKISYSGTSLKSAVSFRHSYKELALSRKKKVVIERQVLQPGIRLEEEQIHQFGRLFIPECPGKLPETQGTLPGHVLSEIQAFESFIPGLTPYY